MSETQLSFFQDDAPPDAPQEESSAPTENQDFITQFISHEAIPEAMQHRFLDNLSSELRDQLNQSSSSENKQVPLVIYNERLETIDPIIVETSFLPPEPGEEGSVLAYIRAHGFDENFLWSDCFGQLSCSSCAIELLKGRPDNPAPREEEYDMLDIDEDRPPTSFTRLGCQVKVGSEPMLIKIRKS